MPTVCPVSHHLIQQVVQQTATPPSPAARAATSGWLPIGTERTRPQRSMGPSRASNACTSVQDVGVMIVSRAIQSKRRFGATRLPAPSQESADDDAIVPIRQCGDFGRSSASRAQFGASTLSSVRKAALTNASNRSRALDTAFSKSRSLSAAELAACHVRGILCSMPVSDGKWAFRNPLSPMDPSHAPPFGKSHRRLRSCLI